MSKTVSIFGTFRKLVRSKIAISIVAVLVAGGGGYYFFTQRNTGDRQFVTVTRGSITETVSVTGSTVPTESVELGFGNSGNISRIYSSVGKSVNRGQVLAELNTADLYAQIKQAQATVDTQQAKLDGLKAGARAEDVASSQAALDKAKQDLANLYASVGDASSDSYAKTNDAVRVQLSTFFSNSESDAPKLTYGVSNFAVENRVESERRSVTEVLTTWQTQLAAGNQSIEALDVVLKDNSTYLATVRKLLTTVSESLENAPGLSADTLASYKANVTAALSEVNTASKNLNTISQNIASQKQTVSQSQAQLDLKKAGSAPQDIAAQAAQVANAEAALQSAQAKLQNSQIVAPISGVVTRFDAKVGQFASPGTALVWVISGGAFEIDAQVSETDVAKVAVGNTVSMTLDAFPNETFTGSVFYIDPAQTTTEGVVGYKIKIAFDTADRRMKSGLTANLDIVTRHKDNILIVPQYAILQNDEGTFVQTMENDAVKDVPVMLGLQDRDGNVEVLSGVTEGEQVLNIGLKTQ